MSYGFDEKDLDGPSKSKFIPAGINGMPGLFPHLASDIRYITLIRKVPAKFGMSCEIACIDNNGKILNSRVFEPDPKNQYYTVIVNKTNKFFMNLVRVYCGPGVMIPRINSFEELVDRVIELVGPNLAGRAMRMKVVYNKQGYPNLSMAANWIEPLMIPEKDTTLYIGQKEVFIKPKWTPPAGESASYGAIPAEPEIVQAYKESNPVNGGYHGPPDIPSIMPDFLPEDGLPF